MIVAVAAVYGPDWVYYGVQVHPGSRCRRRRLDRHHRRRPASPGTPIDRPAAKSRSSATGCCRSWRGVAPFLFIAGLLIGVVDDHRRDRHDQRPAGLVAARGSRRTRPVPSRLAPGTRWAARASLALLLVAARMDINEFSLNAFYRNRLVRCYLGADPYSRRASASRRTSPASTTATTWRWRELVEPDGSLQGRCTSSTAR